MLYGFYFHLFCHDEIVIPVTYIDVFAFGRFFAQPQFRLLRENFAFPLPLFFPAQLFYFFHEVCIFL